MLYRAAGFIRKVYIAHWYYVSFVWREVNLIKRYERDTRSIDVDVVSKLVELIYWWISIEGDKKFLSSILFV